MIIMAVYTVTAIAVLITASWALTRWADREWDRHWASINTMLGCSCGDPNEITLHHSHATCLPKQVTR